ncbi:hypothetical protein [Halalkalibacter sp. APA_J-10(15)]|uniref:hypothetical protein n=1 Tax=Halalkalibacter sp. APA_J-10(15) TaxID=2933805 RepID=UPI001FF5D7C6|nr:hypothetical protein [Halalkalibacter sp. APA_J-10(15)]MCK0470474.1 hypothetical protein [Halalkalibacter sp. APA_J-10(15)]
MRREIRFSEKILFAGFSLILLFMIMQDWIPLGSLNDVQAIAEGRSFNEMLIVTMIGVMQILLLMGLLSIFMGKEYPIWVKLWLVIHQICIFAGALLDWWIPYFFGYGAEQRTVRYNQMFGDTHTFLPELNGIIPNTLHTLFHIILLLCIVLTIYITVTNSRKTGM